jgi:predicted transcriptional regulator of viral defense system
VPGAPYPAAMRKTLSRLAKEGRIQRVGRGRYALPSPAGTHSALHALAA